MREVPINENNEPPQTARRLHRNPLFLHASDGDGSIAQVQFFNGDVLLGSATQVPYTMTLANAPVGVYSLSAKATDNLGASTSSAAVALNVAPNSPPTVGVDATPVRAIGPANISLSANAADSDGGIAQVEFFNGDASLAVVKQAPFRFDWNGVAVGVYSVTAKATDNLGASATSLPLVVTVTPKPTQVYYVQVDHLDTPRLITDANNTPVWRWDQDDPFGGNMANQDPGNTGKTFEFNLRFPGQYFDKETGLHYNYFRDYDPGTGRYLQSDPIGLAAGPNTYLYGDANPISKTDPLGLATFMCTKPLHALGGDGAKSGADIWGNPLYHQYLCVSDGKGGHICGGQDQRGKKWYDPLNGPGKPSNDSYDKNTCEQEEPDNDCIEKCLLTKFNGPRPRYGIPFGTDCQEWSDDALKQCQKCKKK